MSDDLFSNFGETSVVPSEPDSSEDVLVSSNQVGSEYIQDMRPYLGEASIGFEIPPDIQAFSKENLATFPGMAWLKDKDLELIAPLSMDKESQLEQIMQFYTRMWNEAPIFDENFIPGFSDKIMKSFSKVEKVIAYDTETSGLDLRPIYDDDGNLTPQCLLVGFSISWSVNNGFYFPVRHTQSDGILNWLPEVVVEFWNKVVANFVRIGFNLGYDDEVLELNGVTGVRDFPYFLDVQTLSYLWDADKKSRGLKTLSEEILHQPMVHIQEVMAGGIGAKIKEDHIDFRRLPSTTACVYAACDACITGDTLLDVIIE